MVTDYILAGECVILAICLVGKARAGAVNSTGFWVPAFLTFALAALAGGTAHGFRLDLGEVNHAIVWRVTVWSIVAAAAMMLVAGLHSTLRPDTDNPTCRAAGVRWLKMGSHGKRGGSGAHGPEGLRPREFKSQRRLPCDPDVGASFSSIGPPCCSRVSRNREVPPATLGCTRRCHRC